jgi:hypothetical protein
MAAGIEPQQSAAFGNWVRPMSRTGHEDMPISGVAVSSLSKVKPQNREVSVDV